MNNKQNRKHQNKVAARKHKVPINRKPKIMKTVESVYFEKPEGEVNE